MLLRSATCTAAIRQPRNFDPDRGLHSQGIARKSTNTAVNDKLVLQCIVILRNRFIYIIHQFHNQITIASCIQYSVFVYFTDRTVWISHSQTAAAEF